MQRRHISLLLNSACHVSCTNIDALQQVEARLKQLQVLRFVMSQLCAALRTFESPHFDPDVDSWQPSYHCYWQKVFRYNTSVTRPRGGEKAAPHSLLAFKVLLTSYWIVPRKRTEWVIRLWRPLRWTSNFESVTIEQILLDMHYTYYVGKPLETRSYISNSNSKDLQVSSHI